MIVDSIEVSDDTIGTHSEPFKMPREGGVFRFYTSPEKLKTFSMEQLFCLTRELLVIQNLISGLSTKPRYRTSEVDLTDAGNAIYDLTDCFYEAIDQVITVAQLAQPETAEEIKFKTLILLAYHLDCEEDIDLYNIIAAKAISDIAEVGRFAETPTKKPSQVKEAIR